MVRADVCRPTVRAKPRPLTHVAKPTSCGKVDTIHTLTSSESWTSAPSEAPSANIREARPRNRRHDQQQRRKVWAGCGHGAPERGPRPSSNERFRRSNGAELRGSPTARLISADQMNRRRVWANCGHGREGASSTQSHPGQAPWPSQGLLSTIAPQEVAGLGCRGQRRPRAARCVVTVRN